MEWKPIETAPKDGADVMLYCSSMDMNGFYKHHFRFGYYDLQKEWGGATHWAPLPEPPAT